MEIPNPSHNNITLNAGHTFVVHKLKAVVYTMILSVQCRYHNFDESLRGSPLINNFMVLNLCPNTLFNRVMELEIFDKAFMKVLQYSVMHDRVPHALKGGSLTPSPSVQCVLYRVFGNETRKVGVGSTPKRPSENTARKVGVGNELLCHQNASQCWLYLHLRHGRREVPGFTLHVSFFAVSFSSLFLNHNERLLVTKTASG